MRSLVEALVCLALAVVLFRTFEVEGYMISTGSMAPCLLGYHKRVRCPSCGYCFAYGRAYDASEGEHARTNAPRSANDADVDVIAAGSAGDMRLHPPDECLAECPNCGRRSIDTSEIPLNHGDQLLVFKSAYAFRSPQRWEVAVFRNPNQPTQAYVKRIAGLPGETVEIRDGDLYIDGMIRRKNLTQQRAMRILVHDHDYEPENDPQWQAHWEPAPSTWKAAGHGFDLDGSPTGAFEWLNYHHWIREGGLHKTAVRLQQLPQKIEQSVLDSSPVRYHSAAHELVCTGVLPAVWRDRLLALADDVDYSRAVDELYHESRLAPVTDAYGYNSSTGGIPPIPVRDLMLSMDLTIRDGGSLTVRMTDGDKTFDCVINAFDDSIALFEDEASIPVRTAKLSRPVKGRTLQFEMSLFDRQVLVAVDGSEAFETWPFLNRGTFEPSRGPVRIGGRGLSARVDSLKLFRDVHYTQKSAEPSRELGPDEYFVLGDNSPVSYDSRAWPGGAIHSLHFLGKPFIVHLPSRPGKIQLAGRTRYIRIPDS